MAAARYVSAAAMIGVRPSSRNRYAIFPTVVVLPLPVTPTASSTLANAWCDNAPRSARSGRGRTARLAGGARLRAAPPDDDAALELHVSLEAHTEHRADAVCIDGDAPQDVRCGHRDVVVGDDDELLQLREPAQQAGEAHHVAVVERSVNFVEHVKRARVDLLKGEHGGERGHRPLTARQQPQRAQPLSRRLREDLDPWAALRDFRDRLLVCIIDHRLLEPQRRLAT